MLTSKSSAELSILQKHLKKHMSACTCHLRFEFEFHMGMIIKNAPCQAHCGKFWQLLPHSPWEYLISKYPSQWSPHPPPRTQVKHPLGISGGPNNEKAKSTKASTLSAQIDTCPILGMPSFAMFSAYFWAATQVWWSFELSPSSSSSEALLRSMYKESLSMGWWIASKSWWDFHVD